MKDFKLERYNNNRSRRDFARQSGLATPQVVNTVFGEPVHQLLEKIRKEPYFKWPNKMAGDYTKRNQNLICHYHQDVGHTIENCQTLWNHLEQLVFHINGQTHHRIGSLLLVHGQKPKYAQLYIYETDNEVKNRIDAVIHEDDRNHVDPDIVTELMEMLDQCNQLVKYFRMVKDRLK
ncbi:uncharacterized protein LOC142635333 [Castanea sativa]|uniref:uncharacterized protein LOC142635333 n=1 Tax=Castanea sativa TaxID=21020 RepID=UPI003F64EF23